MPEPAGYRALADLLRARISSGAVAPGQTMPSESSLAQTYGLSVTTARRAIAVLRNEGLIDVRPGYPPRVREVGPITDVDLPPTRVWARMPTPQEREEWEVPDGWPVLVAVDLTGGRTVWPAHRYRLNPGALPA